MKKNYNSFPSGPTSQGKSDGGDFTPSYGGQKSGGGGDFFDRLKEFFKKPVKVNLPDHLYIPPGAQSLDMRNLFDVAAGATIDVIRFTAPLGGGITRILSYGIFNDGLLAANFDFIPTVDGRRVYPFQGDPLDNFRIYLGVSPDLSNSSLIPGLLDLAPGQTLVWQAQNRSVVTTTMGVRVTGFIDRDKQVQSRFGG